MTKTTTRRTLPEKYRLARNIEEGYEIQSHCKVHNRDEWVRVTSALHITAPVKVSAFTVEPVDASGCSNGLKVSAHPEDDVFSRRPAVAS
jgi:hypothetical protein